ncbi:MAG: thioredoxin [Micavibrio sp.]|nr:thioredoxin [Micavibrio sp.]
MKTIFSILTLSAIALLNFSTPSQAQSFNEEQKAELQKMFNEYLMNNGELILESVTNFQNKQLAEQQKETNEKAAGFMADIKKDSSLPMTGNKDGDITVVEFFDYNCGYCRKALTEINKLLEADKNVKIVFIDMPILGPQSQVAAQWSLAAEKQGKYFEYHKEIMNLNGPKNAENLKKIAKKIGLNVKQLEKDKDSDDVKNMISANLEKARNLNIQGTPAFIIENKVARGYISADQMQKMIADIRKK